MTLSSDNLSLDQEREGLRQQWRSQGWYGSEETIAERMAAGAVTFARRQMVFSTEQGLQAATLDQIHNKGVALAGGLYALGLRPGDILAFQLPTCIESAYIYQAACALGLVVLPIVHIYGPAEVGFILRQSQAKALVIPAAWRGVDYLERLNGCGPIPSLSRLVVVGDRAPAGASTWSQLEALGTTEFPRPIVDPYGVHMLVYTSGSSAEPKGVQHSHCSLLHEARMWSHFAAGLEQTYFFQPNPVGHMAGILATFIRPFVHGQQSVALDVWDSTTAVSLIRKYQPKTSSGVTFVLDALLNEVNKQQVGFPLERFLIGGGDIPPALIRAADEMGCTALRSYGSTEHPTVTGCTPGDPLDKRVATDGRPMPGVSIRIVDDEGRDTDVGTEGEIWAVGPEQFIGYSDDRLNRESFGPGGWFKTGDMGRLDHDGYLTVTGRKKDVIIRGGENISATEAERVLLTHAAVREATVAAAPDPRYGERVFAFVVLNNGQRLDLDDVRRHFESSGVARQKTPEGLRVLDQLPRTALGKVKKNELREQLEREFG